MYLGISALIDWSSRGFTGCGKTVQAISVMMHYKTDWPVLILVPVALMKQWPDELKKYAKVRDKDINCVTKATDKVRGKITIVPYSIIDKLVQNEAITPDQFGVVIADESHNLKSKDAQRTLAVLPFLQRANVALCLTGTPCTNRPVELYSQLCALLPEVLSNSGKDYSQFVHRYCDAKPTKFGTGMDVRGHSNDAELHKLLFGLVMIRRTKADVIDCIPDKVREIRYVEPDQHLLPELRRIQKRSDEVKAAMRDPRKGETELQELRNEDQQLLNNLYKVTGLSKIQSIKVELVKLIEEARKSRLEG